MSAPGMANAARAPLGGGVADVAVPFTDVDVSAALAEPSPLGDFFGPSSPMLPSLRSPNINPPAPAPEKPLDWVVAVVASIPSDQKEILARWAWGILCSVRREKVMAGAEADKEGRAEESRRG